MAGFTVMILKILKICNSDRGYADNVSFHTTSRIQKCFFVFHPFRTTFGDLKCVSVEVFF